jgi:hypothetical protein
MLCLSGQGSVAGWEELRKLIADGATVRYHGDFDWPGIQITSRAYAGGGEMWRMGKVDYVSAVAQAGERVALEGKPLPTPWDLRLRSAMTSADTAIHEEAVAGLLPADIGSCLLLGVGGVLFATGDSGTAASGLILVVLMALFATVREWLNRRMTVAAADELGAWPIESTKAAAVPYCRFGS